MGTFAGFLYHQLAVKPKPLPANIRLDGKTALITGANAGLGLEASRELAAHGIARLILAVRKLSNGETAKQELQAHHPGVDIEIWQLDQEDWASIEGFGQRAASLDRLDIAILNAGIRNVEYKQSRTGHEQQVQVNHLGTALVSAHVLGPLDRTAKATGQPTRLTIVSSENHFWCKALELKAPNALHELDTNRDAFKTDKFERYNTSKLLNVLWMRELSARITKLGMNIVVNAVNPGLCMSTLHRSDPEAGDKIFRILAYTVEQGGHALTDAAVQHGGDRGVYLSEQKVKKPSAFVLSLEGAEAQSKMWTETVALLTGEAQSLGMLNALNQA